MKTLNHQQIVRCPNCGHKARRFYFLDYCQKLKLKYLRDRVIKTECHACDYLMIMSSLNGRVIEAHCS